MPRRLRIVLPDVPIHAIQRGNNRNACFFADADYTYYLYQLKCLAEKYKCAIHAYALLTNHVHLLLTPAETTALSLLMKHLGQCYVQYVNRRYCRSGTLWEGRFHSCITQEESYLLRCYRYIELYPVRAHIVRHPREYRWSSYRHNAEGEHSKLLAPHALYRGLGESDAARRVAYRALFRDRLDLTTLDEIRQATNGNFALGSERFRRQVEHILGRRAGPGKAGRPRGIGVRPRFRSHAEEGEIVV